MSLGCHLLHLAMSAMCLILELQRRRHASSSCNYVASNKIPSSVQLFQGIILTGDIFAPKVRRTLANREDLLGKDSVVMTKGKSLFVDM